MPRAKGTPANKALFWKRLEAGVPYLDIMKELGISQRTYFSWKSEGIVKAETKGIIPPKDWKPEVKKCMEDSPDGFERFFNRYSGLTLKPHSKWLVEAAWDQSEIILNIPPNHAKALALDTPIATPSGWSTIGDLEVGDLVFGENGEPIPVIAKSPVYRDRPVYRVRTDCGDEIVADQDHIWKARLDRRSCRHLHTTATLANPRSKRAQIDPSGYLQLPDIPLPVDPYVLGVWLGDGHSAAGRVTSSLEDQPQIQARVQEAGYVVKTTGRTDWAIAYPFSLHLRQLGVLRNKHIPAIYLRASREQRLALLQGLMDTDGSVAPEGQACFTSTNKRLAEGARELVRTLGAKASLCEGQAVLRGKDCGPMWRVHFYLPGAATLPRKAARTRAAKRAATYVDARRDGHADVQCIQVGAPDGMFLAGRSMTPTHNSTVFSVWLAVWHIARDRNIRVAIISETDALANKFVSEVRAIFQKPALIKDFGPFIPENPDPRSWMPGKGMLRVLGSKWTGDYSYMARGSGQEIEGMRFDLIIADDVMNPKRDVTPEARQKLHDWYVEVVVSRPGGEGTEWVIGTRKHPEDIYGRLLQKKYLDGRPIYKHINFPALRDPATGEPSLADDALALWPHDPADGPCKGDRCGKCKDRPFLMKMLGKQENTFFQTFQQVPLPSGWGPFRREWFEACRDRDRRIGEPVWSREETIRVISLDPSAGSGYQGWLVADLIPKAVEFVPGIIDLGHEIAGPLEMLSRIRDLHRKYGPIDWLVWEGTSVFKHYETAEFKALMKELDIKSIRHETGINKNSQEVGVETLAAPFSEGRIRLPYGTREAAAATSLLCDEAEIYPHGKTSDVLMALWFLAYNWKEVRRRYRGTVLTKPITRFRLPPRLKNKQWVAA